MSEHSYLSVDDFGCIYFGAYIYENVFLKLYFCARKGLCEVNHLEYVVVFYKLTAKGAITNKTKQ